MRALLSLGAALGRRRPHLHLRFMALCIATWGVCLSLFMLVAAHAVHADREFRAFHVGPLPVTAGHPEVARSLFTGYRTVNEHQVAVFALAPTRKDAPAPPGLTHWPQPGHSAYSAKVASLGQEAVRTFGQSDPGLIDTQALPSPSDAVVYVRPYPDQIKALKPISGWGDPTKFAESVDPSASSFGIDFLNASPLTQMVLAIAATSLAGSVIALVIASRIGRDRRQQDMRVAAAMGASYGQRIVLLFRSATTPVLTGLALCLMSVCPLFLTTVHIPFAETWFIPRQFTSAFAQFGAALFTGTALCLLCVVLDGARVQVHSTRTTQQHDGFFSRNGLIVCLACAACAMWLPLLAGGERRAYIYLAFTLGVIAVFTPALANGYEWLGTRISSWARARGNASALVAGRLLQRNPHRVARLAAGVGIALLLFGQINVWTSYLGRQYHEAVAVKKALNDTMLVASPGTVQNAKVNLSSAPPQTARLWINSGTAQVIAGCPDLTVVDLPCRSETVTLSSSLQRQKLGAFLSNTRARVEPVAQQGSAPGDQWQLLLASKNGQPLDRAAITASSMRATPGGLTFETPGESTLVQARVVSMHARWVSLWGSVALFVLAIAAACALIAGALTETTALVPLGSITGSYRWSMTVMLLVPGLGVALSSATSAGLYLCLPYAFSKEPLSMHASGEMASMFIVIGVGVAFVSALAGARSVARATKKWVPGRD